MLSKKQQNDIDKDLKVYYSFNKEEFPIYDNSGNGNHIKRNTPLPEFGSDEMFKSHLVFDGTDKYLEIPKYQLSEGTISIWMNGKSNTTQIIIGSYNSLSIGLMSNTIIGFSGIGMLKGDIIGSTWIDDKWNQITITKKGSNIQYYINGSPIGTNGTDQWSWSDTDYSYIGKRNPNTSGSPYNAKCKIADLRLYNSILTPDQVKNLYESKTKLDKNGNLYTSELIEIDEGQPKILKNGTVQTEEFIEIDEIDESMKLFKHQIKIKGNLVED